LHRKAQTKTIAFNQFYFCNEITRFARDLVGGSFKQKMTSLWLFFIGFQSLTKASF